MKSISLLAAVLIAMSPLALTAKPVAWRDGNMRVIFNSGDKKITLVFGLNALNKATSFDCESRAGCIVGASATAQVLGANGATYLCTYIDSKPANPACGKVWDSDDVMNLRQYAVVNQGAHSVQTTIYSDDLSNGPVVHSWETEYTIYTRK